MFTEYEIKINSLVDKIIKSQKDFYTANGRYFEGKKTGDKFTSTKPNLVIKDKNEKASIPFIEVQDELPIEIRIDEHKNWNDGRKGFTVVLKTVSEGKEYLKTIGHGIDEHGKNIDEKFETEWTEYIKPITNLVPITN